MTSSMHKVLIVDDEDAIRDVLSASLQDEGYQVETANNGEKALRMLEDFKPDVTLLDIWMPGKLDGVQVLQQAKTLRPDLDFIIMSGHGTIETAVKTTKYGAWDFVEKPLSIEKILILIKNVLDYQQERREKKALLDAVRKNIAIVGQSETLKLLKQNVARAAQSPNWALIEGLTGVGKSLVAQNIHYLGSTMSRPFVTVNSRTLPAQLLEFELFGYEKGAVPGAVHAQKGKLEMAEGGTVFINEIANFPAPLQKKLLETLETGTFKRVGGLENIKCLVRVLCGTAFDIRPQVENGKFLRPLFDRLTQIPLQIPPLKVRQEDLPALIQHFSDYFARENAVNSKSFDGSAIEEMQKYEWPGNVRELRNFIERIYILSPSNHVGVDALEVAGLEGTESDEGPMTASTLKAARALFEKQFIQKKLYENNGNVTKTADQIGVERSHLHRKIKVYGIETKESIQ